MAVNSFTNEELEELRGLVTQGVKDMFKEVSVKLKKSSAVCLAKAKSENMF